MTAHPIDTEDVAMIDRVRETKNLRKGILMSDEACDGLIEADCTTRGKESKHELE